MQHGPKMISSLLSVVPPLVTFGSLFSIYAALIIPANRSRSFRNEQEIRETLVHRGRQEDAEQYLAATLAWRNSSLFTQIGSPPPVPVIFEKDPRSSR